VAIKTVIEITHDETSADAQAILAAEADANRLRGVNKLLAYINGLAGGIRKAQLKVGVNAAQASGTVTFSGVGAASDTILINGVTFTAVASGATGNQWNVGASAALSASALASAINASVSSLISGYVTASAASGVVTITAVRPGINGNCMTLAEGVDGSNHMAVSGARLTGGTSGAVERTHTFGGYA